MRAISKNKYINTLLWQARIMQRAGYKYSHLVQRAIDLRLASNEATCKVVHIRPMGVIDDRTKTYINVA